MTALAWTTVVWLATYAIHSTILLLAAWAIDRGLRERPEFTSPLWKIAALGGLVTASLSVGASIDPWAGRVELPGAPAVAAAPVVPVSVPAPLPDPVVASPVPVVAEGMIRPVAVRVAAVAPSAREAARWPALVAGLWAAGLLIAVASLIGARWRLRRALSGRVAATGPLYASFAQLRRRVPRCPRVRLSTSSRVAVPLATGVLTAEIVVPTRAASTLSAAAQRSMLAHELAHVLRRDPAWRLLLLALERVFFFQPLLRLARRRVEQDAEYLCDAWAAARTEAPLELARCLTEIAGWVRPRSQLAMAATMPHPRSILGRRVLRLLESNPPDARPRVGWALLLGIGCAALPVAAPSVSWAQPPAELGAAPSVAVHDGGGDVRGTAPLPAAIVAVAAAEAPPPARADRPEARKAARAARRARRDTARALRRVIRHAEAEQRVPELDELGAVLERSDVPEATGPVLWIVGADAGAAVTLDAPAVAITFDDAELAAIAAEAQALAEAARALEHARAGTAPGLEARARALRDRARAQADASRASGARPPVLRRAVVAPPPPFAPPAPPAWAPEIRPAVAPAPPAPP